MTRMTCGKCDDGWICKVHPDQPWPHDQCPGPAMPCEVAACPYLIDFRPVTTRTGLTCPRCRQPVATVEDEGAGTAIFQCPRCSYRWSTDHAATKVH
jgi:hypothetical protein